MAVIAILCYSDPLKVISVLYYVKEIKQLHNAYFKTKLGDCVY